MRRLVSVLLILFVAGCSAEKREVAERQPAMSRTSPVSLEANRGGAATDAVAANVPTGNAVAGQDRAVRPRVIRNARVELQVRNVSAAISGLELAAERLGGYSANSRRWSDGDMERATSTYRVPEARLSEFLKQARTLATRVRSEELSGDDVSQEYVDLSSQLKNLEATEVELRQLVTTIRVRSQKASEVLEVYRELVNIRGEIERARGRLQYLDQMTSFATVTIDVMPDAMMQPPVKSGWQPLGEIVEATRALTSTLQWLGSAAIWFFICVVPILLLIAGAIIIIRRVVMTLTRRPVAA
jgi:hypothetical protein